MQALTVTGEIQHIDMVPMLMLCSASLLLYVAAMCHNARSKQSAPR